MQPVQLSTSVRIKVFSSVLALLVASCGRGLDDSGASATSDPAPVIGTTTTITAAAQPATTEVELSADISPCDIVGTSEVGAAFRGTVSPGASFPGGICRFGIEGGAAEWVDVVYLGSAENWEDVVARNESTRGGIIQVEGVGEDAFHPQDHGVRDLIFVANGEIYAVLGFGGPTDAQLTELGESVAVLAMTIADPSEPLSD